MEQKLISDVIWRTMDVRELVRLCQTSTYFKSLCDNPETWRFLLKRDFKIDYSGNDTLKKYVKQLLKLFAKVIFKVSHLFEDELRPRIKSEMQRQRNLQPITIPLHLFNMQERIAYFRELGINALGFEGKQGFSNLYGNRIGKEFADFISQEKRFIQRRRGNIELSIFDILINLIERYLGILYDDPNYVFDFSLNF